MKQGIILFMFVLGFEIMLEAVISKKVPKVVRILPAGIIALVYGGIGVLLFVLAFSAKSGLILAIAVIYAIVIILSALNKLTEYRNRTP